MNFSTDFVAPAAFYNILTKRWSENPIYIQRKKKSSPIKSLHITLIKFIPLKLGKLYVSTLSLKISGSEISDVAIHSTTQLKYNCTYGAEKTITVPYSTVSPSIDRETTALLSSSNSHYIKMNLLVIVFIEASIDRSVDEVVKDVILNNAIASSNILFNVFEVSCRKFGTSDLTNNIRSYYSPLRFHRQTIRIMQKLRNTFLSSVYTNSKADLTIDLDIDICNPELNNSAINHIDSNNSSKITLKQNSSVVSTIVEKIIYFHYLHDQDRDDLKLSSDHSCLVEVSQIISCPWCRRFDQKMPILFNDALRRWTQTSTKSVLSLLSHLDKCHLHFNYDAVIDEQFNLHIVVQRDRSTDLDILKEKFQTFKFKAIKKSMKNQKVVIRNLLLRSKYTNEVMSDKDNRYRVQHSEKVNPHTRMYYHARLGLPLTNFEFLHCDSDDEIDMSYENTSSNRSLNEFEDIPCEEKEFMKLWNYHIHTCCPYANQYVPIICEMFATDFGSRIIEKKLRHNCLIHYLNLMDFNLIRKNDIKKCMYIIDSYVKPQVEFKS